MPVSQKLVGKDSTQVNHRLRKIKEMEREKLLLPEGL